MALFTIAAAAGALFLGVLGAEGHSEAKSTNEQAENLIKKAEKLYDTEKYALTEAKDNTEKMLYGLGTTKNNIMQTSMKQFLESYTKIKKLNFKESTGLNELSKFTMSPQDALEIQEIVDVYKTALQTGAAGAATSVLISLAASGTLPVVTGLLSTAGTALTFGSVGLASSLATSALSIGWFSTPLTAIVAPAVFFSGISSAIKADENYEKAKTTYEEAKAAVAKMQLAKTECEAITKRADMYNTLLKSLNLLFARCVRSLERTIANYTDPMDKSKIHVDKFSQKDFELIAVTRALAGAIKAIIDLPILSEDGKIAPENTKYKEVDTALPEFKKQVNSLVK